MELKLHCRITYIPWVVLVVALTILWATYLLFLPITDAVCGTGDPGADYPSELKAAMDLNEHKAVAPLLDPAIEHSVAYILEGLEAIPRPYGAKNWFDLHSVLSSAHPYGYTLSSVYQRVIETFNITTPYVPVSSVKPYHDLLAQWICCLSPVLDQSSPNPRHLDKALLNFDEWSLYFYEDHVELITYRREDKYRKKKITVIVNDHALEVTRHNEYYYVFLMGNFLFRYHPVEDLHSMKHFYLYYAIQRHFNQFVSLPDRAEYRMTYFRLRVARSLVYLFLALMIIFIMLALVGAILEKGDQAEAVPL